MSPEAEGFVRVCHVDEIPSGTPLRVDAHGRGVLLSWYRMRVVAVDELCPHRDQSMAGGFVIGPHIVCPHHNFRFHLVDGTSSEPHCPAVGVFSVRVVEDEVWVGERTGGSVGRASS